MKQLSIVTGEYCYPASDVLEERVEGIGYPELRFVGDRLFIFRLN